MLFLFNYRSTFNGLRSNVEYVIKISFVMSGRKLGSESYTILSHDNPNRKPSNTSTISSLIRSKDSCFDMPSPKPSIERVSNRARRIKFLLLGIIFKLFLSNTNNIITFLLFHSCIIEQ